MDAWDKISDTDVSEVFETQALSLSLSLSSVSLGMAFSFAAGSLFNTPAGFRTNGSNSGGNI